MTALLTRPESPSPSGGMPGWTIVADLTPPELINSRWIAVLQRRMAIGLVLVLVLCAAAFTYATIRSTSAEDDATAAIERTTYLNRSADRYVGITRIETTVSSIDAQLTTVMANDVDVARVVASISRELPTSMSIQSLSLTLNAVSTIDGETGLDTSGRPTIGTATITGSGQGLNDLPSFVEGLSGIRGFVNVLPTSNEVSKDGSQFSVGVTLTDQLLSHRYDGSKNAAR